MSFILESLQHRREAKMRLRRKDVMTESNVRAMQWVKSQPAIAGLGDEGRGPSSRVKGFQPLQSWKR